MDRKQLRPVFGGEDPSLPWPDCSDINVPAQPGTGPEGLPTPEVPPASDGSNTGSQLPNDSIDPRLLALAMGFVPYQAWETPYEFDVALKRGSIFPSLDKPFLGEEAVSQ